MEHLHNPEPEEQFEELKWTGIRLAMEKERLTREIRESKMQNNPAKVDVLRAEFDTLDQELKHMPPDVINAVNQEMAVRQEERAYKPEIDRAVEETNTYIDMRRAAQEARVGRWADHVEGTAHRIENAQYDFGMSQITDARDKKMSADRLEELRTVRTYLGNQKAKKGISKTTPESKMTEKEKNRPTSWGRRVLHWLGRDSQDSDKGSKAA